MRTFWAMLIVMTRRSLHSMKRQLHSSWPSDALRLPQLLCGSSSPHSTHVAFEMLLLLVQGGVLSRQLASRDCVSPADAAALRASSSAAPLKNSAGYRDWPQMVSDSVVPQGCQIVPAIPGVAVVVVLPVDVVLLVVLLPPEAAMNVTFATVPL
eukprot:GHRQ01025923.1.p1 GENE.GHRQ01025923.1~~GHRQ01025923.1.p1  ORF type:complete len:154 (+),score=26.00 GHRQ01025923.1:171-632(+)